MSRRRTEPLNWKWSDGFYFAHPHYGMWTIEQRRGRFYVTLDLKGAPHDATQTMGDYRTSKLAQAAAARDHRALVKQDA